MGQYNNDYTPSEAGSGLVTFVKGHQSQKTPCRELYYTYLGWESSQMWHCGQCWASTETICLLGTETGILVLSHPLDPQTEKKIQTKTEKTTKTKEEDIDNTFEIFAKHTQSALAADVFFFIF